VRLLLIVAVWDGTMGIFFDQERRLICAIARDRDLAASACDPSRRAMFSNRAAQLARHLPQTRAERLLLSTR
jgi:hypothetical protein